METKDFTPTPEKLKIWFEGHLTASECAALLTFGESLNGCCYSNASPDTDELRGTSTTVFTFKYLTRGLADQARVRLDDWGRGFLAGRLIER